MNTTMLAFGGIGIPEVLLILAVVLILFGAKKLPELARGMGQGIREFRNASRELQRDLEEAVEETSPKPPKSRLHS